jgi:hypothetical protein
VSFKGTAEGLTKTSLSNGVKEMVEAEKEGGERRIEQGVCHVLACEKESYPSTPPTEQEPEIPGKESETVPPEPGLETVPNCELVEVTGAACLEMLENAGFNKVELDTLDWQHAVLSRSADTAISVDPSSGSIVETSTKIVVTQNPIVMPLILPAPGSDEIATTYKTELESAGFTNVSISTVPEIDIDTSVGPDAVTSVDPAPGTGTDPDGSTAVRVSANPDNAPAPSEVSKGGLPGPTLPGIHVPQFTVFCTRFPFGVPCWMYEEFSAWSTTRVVPEWEIPIEWKALGWRTEFAVSLAPFEGAMEVIRPVLVALSTISLVMLFYAFATGSSPGTGGGGSDDVDDSSGV